MRQFENYITLKYDQTVRFITAVYHTKHTVWDIVTQLCFMVAPAFLMVFMPLAGAYFELSGYTFTDEAIRSYSFGLAWINFFLNALFMLVLIEITQSIVGGYMDWTRDNL